MGLRERKKEQTRRAIEDAAFRLFEERGYQATTVADIADAADIAPRTFFAYFPSKEAVVFGDFDDTFGTLDARLRERPDGENTFEGLRAWIGELIESDQAVGDRDHLRRCLIRDNEALAAHERHVMGRFEQLIAENVARDLGDDPDDLQPRLVAAAAVAALLAMSHKDDEHRKGAVDEEGLAQLDDAFAFLRGGIAALQERRASFG
ncbi:MAG TPA: TetR family transcriptional regulator [Baekduia sp.]|nr:TetR family transcriptional regulator [Baekduia sp.]